MDKVQNGSTQDNLREQIKRLVDPTRIDTNLGQRPDPIAIEECVNRLFDELARFLKLAEDEGFQCAECGGMLSDNRFTPGTALNNSWVYGYMKHRHWPLMESRCKE